MSWEIKSKDNTLRAIPSTKPEYNDMWMEECYVTVSIESPTPIDFEIGDYLIYRGERFEINYDPGKIKSAPRYTKGDAFKYENVKFNSLADELTRCDFLDVVLEDNQLHFTGLPKFSFYGGVQDLANRIQANLDRAYGKNTWRVIVSPEFKSDKELNVSADNIKVQGALSILVNDFETYFTIKDRTITIGAAGIPAGHLFKYGKGNGLYEIEQNAEADQAIVTRVRAYGSTRNLPHRYYNSLTGADGKKLIPDNMAVQNLMLPGFPEKSLRELETDASLKPLRSNNRQDPYIDSPDISKLGVREGTIFFDGSQDGLPEIYPSIEGMTAEDLHKAGVPCNATGSLDEIVSAEQMTDNGVGEIKGDNSELAEADAYFKVTLKDLAFDINDYIIEGNTETPSLSFKSGKLGGREFEIFSCKPIKNGSGAVTGYELELKRVFDDGIKLWFPYKDYNAAAGDKIVILHIGMPPVYIKANSQKMLEKTEEWLSKNDYSRSIYAPKIDEIFMARQHDEAMASGGKIASLHDTIRAGMLLLFEDEDLNIDASIFIDRLTIKEGDGPIPTYEVVLKEEKTVGRLDKMQNQIDSLASGKGQGGVGGYTAAQIRSMIDAYGGARFLSKIYPDISQELIQFIKGIIIGEYSQHQTGGIIDEAGFAELESLLVRKEITTETLTVTKYTKFFELIIDKIRSSGGAVVLSPADGFKVYKVAAVTGGFRLYFQATDGDRRISNMWRGGDQALCQTFNNASTGTSYNVSNKYYWALVTESGTETDADGDTLHYITVSSTVKDGDVNPEIGDEIVMLGYRGSDDPARQSAIYISAYDSIDTGIKAPLLAHYKGINDFNLSSHRYSWLASNGNMLRGKLRVEDGTDIEDYVGTHGVGYSPNLLNGTGKGRDGWSAVTTRLSDSDDDTERIPVSPWPTQKPWMSAGYTGVALTVGGLGLTGCDFKYKSDGWTLAPGKTYTLSFALNTARAIPKMVVYLSGNGLWGGMLSDFRNVPLSAGLTKVTVNLTTETPIAASDSVWVVLGFTDGFETFPPNTGVELGDLKLEEGINDNPVWTPSNADLKGQDGVTPHMLVLDNPNAYIRYDSAGDIPSDPMPSCGFKVLKGDTNVTDDWAVSITTDGCLAEMTAGKVVFVEFESGRDSASVTVKAAKQGETALSAVMRIAKVKDGAQGKAGDNGDYTSYAFKRSSAKPERPTTTVHAVPPGWADAPTSEGRWWMSKCAINGNTGKPRTGDDGTGAWSDPVQCTAEDGVDGGYTDFKYRVYDDNAVPYIPPSQKTARNPSGWSDTPVSPGANQGLWMIQAEIGHDNTLNGEWSDPARISGPKGIQGIPGAASVMYALIPSATFIRKGFDGQLDPATLSCQVLRITGGDREMTGDHLLKVQPLPGGAQMIWPHPGGVAGAVSVPTSATAMEIMLADSDTGLSLAQARIPVLTDAADIRQQWNEFQTDYTGLKSEVGTLTQSGQKISALEQTAERISLKVRETPFSRNLLGGTNKGRDGWCAQAVADGVAVTAYPWSWERDDFTDRGPGVGVTAGGLGLTAFNMLFSSTVDVELEANRQYSLSFTQVCNIPASVMAYLSGDGTWAGMVSDFKARDTEAGVTRPSFTLTVKDDYSGPLQVVIAYRDSLKDLPSGGAVGIGDLQLEDGAVPTAYSRSESDLRRQLLDTGIDVVAGRVTVTADNFVVQDNDGVPMALIQRRADGTPMIAGDLISADTVEVYDHGSAHDPLYDIALSLNRKGSDGVGDMAYTVYQDGLETGVNGNGDTVPVRVPMLVMKVADVNDFGTRMPSVMQYYNRDGSLRWYLGPDGIVQMQDSSVKWTTLSLVEGLTDPRTTNTYTPTTTIYRLDVPAGMQLDPGWQGKNGLVFVEPTETAALAEPGMYYDARPRRVRYIPNTTGSNGQRPAVWGWQWARGQYTVDDDGYVTMTEIAWIENENPNQ